MQPLKNKIKQIQQIINENLSSKFSKDTIWLVSAQLILLISGLLINLIIGVKLGANNLGVFNQILSYYAIFSTIFSLGLNNTLIKKIASVEENSIVANKLLSSNLLLTAFFSILFTSLIFYISLNFPFLFSSPELAHDIVIPFLSIPFFNLNKNYNSFRTGKREQKLFSIIRSLRWILIIGFISISLIFTKDLTILLFSFLFAEGILFIINTLIFRKHFNFDFNFNLIRSNLSFGLKSFTAELFAIFNEKFDLLIIGYFLTNSEVGVYSFFIFFAKSLFIFPGIIQQNINPIISKYWDNNKLDELQNNISKILKVNLFILLLQTAIILIAYPIIIFFLKQEFHNSFPFLIVAIIGIFPAALVSWSASMFVMTGKLKENLYRTMFIMAFSLATTLLFSNLFGLIGATMAVVINSVVSFLILKVFVNRLFHLKLI